MRLRGLIGRATLLGVAVTVMAATPAFAHVTVNPDSAPQGGFTKLTFRVPNEQDSGDTVKVEVKFPTDHPIASVSVKPHDGGWTAKVDKTPLPSPIKTDDGTVTEAVSLITWSGGKIAPGEFDEFDVSVGPLPDVDQLTFPTVQTYSDGTAVSWIQEAAPGGAEPEHPAPVLKLTAAAGSGGSTASSSGDGGDNPVVTGTTTTVVKKESSALAWIGLIIAVAALVLGGVGVFRRQTTD